MTIGIIFSIILLINLYGYTLMRRDKQQAQRKQSRIPEKTLFLTAFLGGGLGVYQGMKHFRHKTKHTSFRILLPLAALWNLMLYAALLYWLL
ncbi:uncharacterized membrane protein YsdA (DUF1294 family) [Tumebacillus sp. BK434]|uniref:DUF1294 domain-containing protein n=1 Tax=Tumebacillus sp. BK434 TaxID=2512169 RepID=UPI00104C89AB|nr:DUF1294 domain-containing protein [Tumebacillus sp. BK434]TCP58067.1 uncharacterized membrane protein YsdA (DUF1294 family) [Tumebacillus sp. BK434]